MTNEIILVISLGVTYAFTLLAFSLFKEKGLVLWTVLATIAGNIEVLILVRAFGIEMTLGNILFASTFLVTDIASELYGKEKAKKIVYLGIATSLFFICISQSWLFYIPSENDFATPAIQTIFKNTPRVMLSSIIVYVIVQLLDVHLYHRWWNFTTKKFGDKSKFLWLRNNGSTLISQFLNTVLFTLAAFYGTYPNDTIISIIISTYAIFIVTSIADTPFVYFARKLHHKQLSQK